MAPDWQNLFSFGTHLNNGGEHAVAPLGYYCANSSACALNVELPKHGLNIEDVWNKMNAYIIYLHNNMVDYYFNNILFYSMKVGSVPNNFYFNGSGYRMEYLAVFSYLLISDNLNDGLFLRYPAYFDGKDIYGILKKEG